MIRSLGLPGGGISSGFASDRIMNTALKVKDISKIFFNRVEDLSSLEGSSSEDIGPDHGPDLDPSMP